MTFLLSKYLSLTSSLITLANAGNSCCGDAKIAPHDHEVMTNNATENTSSTEAELKYEVTKLGENNVLNDESFEKFIKENDEYGCLVNWGAPWCGYCKKLEPECATAAEKLFKELEMKVGIAYVDGTENPKCAERYNVKGYPTLKFFRHGENIEFDGERTADGIVEWIQMISKPVVKYDEKPDFEKSELIVMLNCGICVDGKPCGSSGGCCGGSGNTSEKENKKAQTCCKAAFEKLGLKFRKDALFYNIPTPEEVGCKIVFKHKNEDERVEVIDCAKFCGAGAKVEKKSDESEDEDVLERLEEDEEEDNNDDGRPKETDPVKIATNKLTENFVELFNKNRLPKFGCLNGESFDAYMQRGDDFGVVWSLFPMEEGKIGEAIEENRPMMTEVHDKLHDAKSVLEMSLEIPEKSNTTVDMQEASEIKVKPFSITWTDTHEFAQVVDNMFGIKVEVPTVVVQLKAGDKKFFVLREDLDGQIFTADYIATWIKKCELGLVQHYLKSEEVPEAAPEHELVQPAVGSNLKDFVFSEDKDVFLQVQAPWCGHCQKMRPEMEKLGKKIKKDAFGDIIGVVSLDGSKNDSPIEAISWTGFPTMFYIKAGKNGENEIIKYEGGRDAKSVWRFIKQNHTQKKFINGKVAELRGFKKAEKANKEAESPAKKEEEGEKVREEL